MTCQSMQKVDTPGYVRFLWESIEEANEFFHLKSVGLACDVSDLNITENNLVPIARCIQDTNQRQLVTRSNL